MKRVMMFLALALLVWPGIVLAQAPTGARQTRQAERPSENSSGIMGSTGQAIKDSWITSKAKAKLIADRRITRAVSVETHAGVVTLRGKVASAEERQVAEQAIHGTDGVKGVRNLLQIVPDTQRTAVDARDKDIKKGVKARLDRETMLRDADITVRSDNAVVTLMGAVADARAAARASELARGTSGVRAVRNEIKIAVARPAR
ncbi:MAG TPA: BON domain-containing protein [Methylomirabilota bacterium]|nr:BON domain-containing protein [Methylomirabilota bacterium]